jgi:beta-glucosidase
MADAPPLHPVDPQGPAASGDMSLGAGFFIGTTTSATQVEGGGIDNDIARWAATHKGWGAPNPGLDHWNRIDEDYAHLGQNGHNAHGFTVDWARIEPQDGVFDQAALAHYRAEVAAIRRHGMEPMVTLFQYALPPWLAERGGVLAKDTPALFARFARVVAEQLGDEVTWWATMNEPNTLAAAGFLAGIWPPGKKSPFAMARALDAQLRMHAAGATAIKEVSRRHGRRSMVSLAYIDDRKYPAQWWNPLDQIGARLYDYVGNRWFLDSIAAGRSLWPVGNGDEIPGLRGSLDYIGLNFYGRGWSHVSLNGGGREGSPLVDGPDPDRRGTPPLMDADGLYELTLSVWNQLHVPVLITENGVDVPEPDAENARGRAIVDSLAALHHAQTAGVKVLGYLHWTDWDSPEWHDGWSQHYGLFGFDPTTGRRWDKPAAATFETLARRLAIPGQWLSADNLQSPAERDGHAAHELRVLRESQRSAAGLSL